MQYKLLLEQKAIMYVYPGDSSPTTREGAWQIVMSVQNKHQQGGATGPRQSNSSDPASDSSQLEEDVFVPPSSDDAVAASDATTVTVPTSAETGAADVPLPPAPPSYSEAVARQAADQQGGVRFQQQQLPGGSTADGILPATRARLASLKSLGSKKLQAIKMRLSDQRQKFDECA